MLDTIAKPFQDPELFRPNHAPKEKETPFTLKEIKDAIPPHLFEADMFKSWYYIGRDIAQFAVAAAVTYGLLAVFENTYARAAIWIAYWFAQSTTGFGLWVIGHECGHGAYFGRNKTLNNWAGYVIHTFFLVPFHAWRITHGTHHQFTNNIEKDTAYPPMHQPGAFYEALEYFPPLVWILFSMWMVLGWVCYLGLNYEGQQFGKVHFATNHFDASSPYFKKSDRPLILLSNFGVAAMLAILGACSFKFGFMNVMFWYGMPWLGTSMWLVCVTFLQHAHPKVPHYDDAEWDFVKGALATVDRKYGGPIDAWMHHITNGHVVHHIFSHMAFYNAIEATPYVAKKLGKYYHYDDRNIFVQIREAMFHHQNSWKTDKVYLTQVAPNKKN